MSVKVAVAGLGHWGKNLVRTSTSSPTSFGSTTRHPSCASRSHTVTRHTEALADFADLLGDEAVEAVVIATPVPTHYDLAKQALLARRARLRREAACDAR